jgi:hypothetical protein
MQLIQNIENNIWGVVQIGKVWVYFLIIMSLSSSFFKATKNLYDR